MLDELRAELESLEAQIKETEARLNQLIGARTFCRFVLDKYGKEGEALDASPKTDEQSPPEETIDLAANGLYLE